MRSRTPGAPPRSVGRSRGEMTEEDWRIVRSVRNAVEAVARRPVSLPPLRRPVSWASSSTFVTFGTREDTVVPGAGAGANGGGSDGVNGGASSGASS